MSYYVLIHVLPSSTAVSVDSLYKSKIFAVIIIKALIYRIRMAGTNVSFATRIDDIGANMADRLPNIITHEYMGYFVLRHPPPIDSPRIL